MKVFIDTSVFIRHYYGSEKAIKILDIALNEEEAVTSTNVIEETFFKLLYIETERLFGESGKYTLKEKFRKESNKYEAVKKYLTEFIFDNVNAGIIGVLIHNEEILKSSVDLAYEFGLLPNDALIAATCKHYGIRKITTFDEDFKRVDFLEVVEL